MKISKDTSEILEFLDFTSEGNLRKRNDLGIILEVGATYGEEERINNILLIGSSLWNLDQTIRRSDSNADGYEKLKSEIMKIADELTLELMELIGIEYPSVTARFKEVYFNDSGGSFRNLIDLSHDISEMNNVRKKLKSKT
jgi:hypothetical protein